MLPQIARGACGSAGASPPRSRSQATFLPPIELTLRSRQGWTELKVRWRVVELWTLPAEALLATNDPGLMPWVPLAEIQGAPEPVLEQCRAVIE